MKKIHLLIIYAASVIIFATGCNRLDVAGMVINRSDTEERVADWLDYNAQNSEPVIENVPDEYCIYSTSDSHYSDRDGFELQGPKDRLYKYVTVERNDPKAIFSLLVGDLANQSGEAGPRPRTTHASLFWAITICTMIVPNSTNSISTLRLIP